jgi:hypothetical protein
VKRLPDNSTLNHRQRKKTSTEENHPSTPQKQQQSGSFRNPSSSNPSSNSRPSICSHQRLPKTPRQTMRHRQPTRQRHDSDTQHCGEMTRFEFSTPKDALIEDIAPDRLHAPSTAYSAGSALEEQQNITSATDQLGK